jgi:hypothetical protein
VRAFFAGECEDHLRAAVDRRRAEGVEVTVDVDPVLLL